MIELQFELRSAGIKFIDVFLLCLHCPAHSNKMKKKKNFHYFFKYIYLSDSLSTFLFLQLANIYLPKALFFILVPKLKTSFLQFIIYSLE